jgi:uracil-DNA glycosylase
VANCGKLLFLEASAYDQASDEYRGQMYKPNQMSIVIFLSYHPQFVYTFDEVHLKDQV